MDPLPILKDLVAIPSVNPMGRDVSGPEFYETRVTEYLVDQLRRLGVEYHVEEVMPGRANVFARLPHRDSAPTILLDAHQDTVPVDGMTVSPFEPTERDGRLYGRGACDVKGGMAAMLAAFTRLVKERPASAPNVILSCTVDEEATAEGINHYVRSWTEGSPRAWYCTKPDVAIVAEPTDLDIVVAHRGASRWKIHTAGRACHSSRPNEGINAIYRMAKVLEALEGYAERLPGLRPPHPLCGPATLSVGRIEGGISVNTVPDACAIEIDRRVIPGEDAQGAIDQVREFLRGRFDFEVEFSPPWIMSPPLSDDNNGQLADRLMQAITAVAGEHQKMGVPYGTHASRTGGAGVPSVVFGPGSIHQAHTIDEWIPIDELRAAAEIYYRFCAEG